MLNYAHGSERYTNERTSARARDAAGAGLYINIYLRFSDERERENRPQFDSLPTGAAERWEARPDQGVFEDLRFLRLPRCPLLTLFNRQSRHTITTI